MSREHVKIATEYARQVVAGEIPACRFVRLACQRQLDDLKRWPRQTSEFYFDARAADRVCNFIELLPHTKGKWAAKQELFVLQPWQQFMVTTIFGWKRLKDGKRRYRKVYDEIPRKNGKSALAAAIGLYLFCADGEYGAEVYSGATTEKQAWEVFRPARLMAMRTPALLSKYGVQVQGASLSIEVNGSRFQPIIGTPGDGSSPSGAIHDEYHEHLTDAQADSMGTGMGAREQPLQLFVTTAGDNLAGPCYDLRKYAIQVLEGQLEDPELFSVIYTLDKDDDWTSEAALRKANPNFGVSVSADFLRSKQREAKQSARKQNAFRTKHLNIWVGARDAWMNMVVWNKAPRAKTLKELRHRRCFIGLDLASKIDLAALLMLFPPEGKDKRWHIHVKFYLPEDRVDDQETPNAAAYAAWAKQGFITLTPGNVIDFDFVERDLKGVKEFVKLEEAGFDPWQATQLATRMLAEGLPMVEVGQQVKNFSEPMKFVEALVKQELLAHGHNPVLSWCASNVVAKTDAKDNIYPRKESEASKIDGIVALLIAMCRAIAPRKTQSTIGVDHELVSI